MKKKLLTGEVLLLLNYNQAVTGFEIAFPHSITDTLGRMHSDAQFAGLFRQDFLYLNLNCYNTRQYGIKNRKKKSNTAIPQNTCRTRKFDLYL